MKTPHNTTDRVVFIISRYPICVHGQCTDNTLCKGIYKYKYIYTFVR